MSLKIEKKLIVAFFSKFWIIRILMQQTKSAVFQGNPPLQVLRLFWILHLWNSTCSGWGIKVWVLPGLTKKKLFLEFLDCQVIDARNTNHMPSHPKIIYNWKVFDVDPDGTDKVFNFLGNLSLNIDRIKNWKVFSWIFGLSWFWC